MRKVKKGDEAVKYLPPKGRTSLDEVAEVILLPRFCETRFAEAEDHRQVVLDAQVVKELREYVTIIASRYQ